MLQLINVSKSFGNTPVLKNINWEVEPNKIYGLVGKNGVGKSTLLRCIADVYPVDTGQVLYNNINAADNPNVKRKVVFVADEPFELNQSSLKQLIEFYEIFYPQFNHSKYSELISLFDFNENQSIENMSKGQKRQSSMIIALSLNPELLLLDESFDGLDPIVRNRFINYLKEQENLTIIISSHNVNDLDTLCDEILIIEENALISKESLIREEGLIKVQVAFTYDITNQMDFLQPLSHKVEGRVHTLIVRQSLDQLKQELQLLHPVLVYPMELSLNELFVLKLKEKEDE
ncbi:MAG: ATP-binding cassette domain-containing protein [Erysipelothrix sp.]|nr:ATP-binding cassette domain-containing protein [Erysipelothrix sp.]